MPGQKNTQILTTTQKLSPQQIMVMKLLQLPGILLEDKIKEEIEINPTLENGDDPNTLDPDDDSEEIGDNSPDDNPDFSGDHDGESGDYEIESDDSFDDYNSKENSSLDYNIDDEGNSDDDTPYYKLSANNSSPDDVQVEIQHADVESLSDRLLNQIMMSSLTKKQKFIATQIIGNIDESGYLKITLQQISNYIAFDYYVDASIQEIEEVLHEVQKLDPPGIAARDLKECLLIQLNQMDTTEDVIIARQIIDKCFDELSKKHFDKILTKLKINEEQFKRAEQIIIHLNPKPGDSSSPTEMNFNYVFPDFIVYIEDNEPKLVLSSRNVPDLRIKKSAQKEMALYASSDKPYIKESANFYKKYIDSAKLFIEAINQRQKTLYNTMSSIIRHQKEFFMTGDEKKIKPMILEDVAKDIKMDISTVSRVVNSKYVRTPYGTYLLKDFFSESMTTDSGEEVSNKKIKSDLKEIIENEDKTNPLTDDDLVKTLNEKGYNIARRTIAKYRVQLGIPSARMRKRI